jgi:4-amino-4-deoxy-L-arabinose transferase-like glycosyltransferase
MASIVTKSANWLTRNDRWEKILAVLVLAFAAILMFYNLDLNPRPWQDEGSAAGIAKSLAQDGVYANKNSDGYQSFGGVQSVGPTVILPIALAYRLWGVGLVQGRLVMALYAVITLIVFYFCAQTLFNRRVAILAVILVLGAQSVGYFIFGRPVLGEVPALGFFLAGWLVWSQALRRQKVWLVPLAGLLFGLAMITKSYYLIMVSGTIGLLVILDIFFYRQRRFGYLLLLGVTAVACYGLWLGWQRIYFGADVFAENMDKLRQMASASSGLNSKWIGDAIKLLIGPGANYYYFFWGFLSLLYIIPQGLRRTRESFLLAFVWLFTVLWLAYFVFWILPIPRYLLPASALTAIFVAKLVYDLAKGFAATSRSLWSALRQYVVNRTDLPLTALVSLGALVGLTSFALLVGYEFQRTVRTDVLDKVGVQSEIVLSPPQLGVPRQIAEFLNQNIDRAQVVETWERELGILTDNNYHFPDQTMLAKIDNALHRGGDQNYSLGADYFNAVRPSYVVVGWFGRLYKVYDINYLNKNAKVVATFGDGDWRYDVYQMNAP